MTTPSEAERTKAWVVFNYEANMFYEMLKWLSPREDGSTRNLEVFLKNAVTESALLHARQLADIFLSKKTHPIDITINLLIPGFIPARLTEFKAAYGKRSESGSVCEVINTRLAHATTLRGGDFDYSENLKQIAPLLIEMVLEIRDNKPATP